jgi:hypothetical protein
MIDNRPTLEVMKAGITRYNWYGLGLGTDPEIFVKDGKTEQLIPAFTFLPEKNEAERTRLGWDIFRYGMEEKAPHSTKFFWDGFQAEWSYDGSGSSYYVNGISCLIYVVDQVRYSLMALDELAKKANPTAKLSLDNVVKISPAWMKKAGDIHVAFGCKPSKNAYGKRGKLIENPRKLPYRFAGGHMHFTLGDGNCVPNEKDPKNIQAIVKVMDAILGVWCVGAARGIDNPIRRKYYGLAGEYRTPKYGFEYRTPSNFWLSHPRVMNCAFEVARAAISLWRSGHSGWWIAPEDEVQSVVNNCDVEGAVEILERNVELFRFLIRTRYLPDEKMFKMGHEGIASLNIDPFDIENNWQFAMGNNWVTHGNNQSGLSGGCWE